MDSSFVNAAKEILGDKGCLQGQDVGARFFTDEHGTSEIIPSLVCRPKSTAELSEIMKLCHKTGQPVAVQCGMTGLVEAARPRECEIVISLERMNKIEETSVETGTMIVQAGTKLQIFQETAEEHDLFFALDLGSRGSCTIGGNLATNAGGNRVIRYALTAQAMTNRNQAPRICPGIGET